MFIDMSSNVGINSDVRLWGRAKGATLGGGGPLAASSSVKIVVTPIEGIYHAPS